MLPQPGCLQRAEISLAEINVAVDWKTRGDRKVWIVLEERRSRSFGLLWAAEKHQRSNLYSMARRKLRSVVDRLLCEGQRLFVVACYQMSKPDSGQRSGHLRIARTEPDRAFEVSYGAIGVRAGIVPDPAKSGLNDCSIDIEAGRFFQKRDRSIMVSPEAKRCSG